MPGDIQAENPRKLRTANAYGKLPEAPLNLHDFVPNIYQHRCIPCRQSKIKCSGDEPCANCKRRTVNCRFVDGASKVVVEERLVCLFFEKHR